MPHKFGGNKLDFGIALSPLALNYNAFSMAGSSCSESQATSLEDPGPYHGSYATDLALGKYTLSWDTLSSMELWLEQEQQSKFIELRLKERERNKKSEEWTEKFICVCTSWYRWEKQVQKEERGLRKEYTIKMLRMHESPCCQVLSEYRTSARPV